jgi:hypothetical protein
MRLKEARNMSANSIAVASDVANEVVSEQAASQEAPAPMDEYGRTESERTIVLSSQDAEAVGGEVDAGGHQAYDDALHYVITRGIAEIKRTRSLQRKNQAKTVLANETTLITNMLAMNPALVADATFVGNMMKKLAELSAKAK